MSSTSKWPIDYVREVHRSLPLARRMPVGLLTDAASSPQRTPPTSLARSILEIHGLAQQLPIAPPASQPSGMPDETSAERSTTASKDASRDGYQDGEQAATQPIGTEASGEKVNLGSEDEAENQNPSEAKHQPEFAREEGPFPPGQGDVWEVIAKVSAARRGSEFPAEDVEAVPPQATVASETAPRNKESRTFDTGSILVLDAMTSYLAYTVIHHLPKSVTHSVTAPAAAGVTKPSTSGATDSSKAVIVIPVIPKAISATSVPNGTADHGAHVPLHSKPENAVASVNQPANVVVTDGPGTPHPLTAHDLMFDTPGRPPESHREGGMAHLDAQSLTGHHAPQAVQHATANDDAPVAQVTAPTSVFAAPIRKVIHNLNRTTPKPAASSSAQSTAPATALVSAGNANNSKVAPVATDPNGDHKLF